MKPIFTIHAGEYLVAAEIEKSLKEVIVWLPSKDTGIDLLLTDKSNKKTVSLQVKFSKDFNVTHVKENMRQYIKGSGWWTLSKEKIENSQADFWVFIIYNLERKTHDYIILEPKKLLDLFKKLKRTDNKLHCYFTVTTNNKAFETRGLESKEMKLLYEGIYVNEVRDITIFLNNWKPITKKMKIMPSST